MRHYHCSLRAWDHNNLIAMAALINVKTLIKFFFTAFLFFFLLLIISAVVALPPKSPPPFPSRITPLHHTTNHRSRSTTTTTTTTTTATPATVKRDDHLQARDPEAEQQPYQVIHIKNATPFFLDGESTPRGGGRQTRRSSYNHQRHHRVKTNSGKSSSSGKIKKKRMKTTLATGKNDVLVGGGGRSGARPFSVMLPKGFVPPSGSSPCHNAKPDESTKGATATFYSCRLSAAEP